MPHPIVDRHFATDASPLLPTVTAETAPYWAGLEHGEIRGLECDVCGTITLPGGPVCAHCGSAAITWRTLSGQATLFAWVRYHRPYLPEFADIVPYVSATVALAEGGRLLARLIDIDGDPRIGMPLVPVIERWPGGRCVPVFAPA